VYDNHLLGLYAKKMGQLLYGWPATVHICHRFGQKHLGIFYISTPEIAVEFAFIKGYIEISGNFVGCHEAGIMPRFLIAGAWISKTDHQPQIMLKYISDKRTSIIKAGWMVCATSVVGHSCEPGHPASLELFFL
jgi:hypothetical protein